jgi:hypothetical protein
MDKVQKIISKLSLLIILILSIPAVRYLFVNGFFGVSDDLHIGWLYEMDRVVKMLQFPPRFVPDISFGFGYPLFNFVYPLPFYVAEVFYLLGFSLVNSMKLLFGLSIPFSMFFMYKFLKHYLSEELSLAGSILYVYAPYRALEIFVRGSVGEILSFVFFPIILLAIIQGKYVILAISSAALILSHNILSYMFFPFAIFFIFLHKKYIFNNFKGLFLGLLASIYFWLPAILESKLMHYDTVFNFYDHFPTLRQFITPYWGYGASVAGPYDTMSFYMGLTGIVVVALGSILFFVKFKKIDIEKKTILIWAVLVTLVSVFMMNHRSAFLWRNLPLLPYFQFPWRFLAMITLVSPLFLISFAKFKYQKILAFLIIIFAIGLNFNYFKTSEYLGRQDDYYINRYIPTLPVSEEYKKTSEEYLRLPEVSEARPQRVYPRAYTEDVDVRLEIKETNALNATITTESEKEFILNYSKYNYPGFTASIDGKRVNIISGKPYGQISFEVSGGQHEIEVKYKESPLRLIFDILSLVTFGYLITLIIRKK